MHVVCVCKAAHPSLSVTILLTVQQLPYCISASGCVWRMWKNRSGAVYAQLSLECECRHWLYRLDKWSCTGSMNACNINILEGDLLHVWSWKKPTHMLKPSKNCLISWHVLHTHCGPWILVAANCYTLQSLSEKCKLSHGVKCWGSFLM